MLSPITCFLAAEVSEHQNFTGFCEFPKQVCTINHEKEGGEDIGQSFEAIRALRSSVHRTIREDFGLKTLAEVDACLHVKDSAKIKDLLQIYDSKIITVGSFSVETDLMELFGFAELSVDFETMDSSLEYKPTGFPSVLVYGKKSNRYKCPRCWIWSADIDGELCNRCGRVMAVVNKFSDSLNIKETRHI